MALCRSVEQFGELIRRFETSGGKITSVKRGWWVFKSDYWNFSINDHKLQAIKLSHLSDPYLNKMVSAWIMARLGEMG